MTGLLNALSLVALLAGAVTFVWALHRWSESDDRGERLVPWLDRDEEWWMDDSDEEEIR